MSSELDKAILEFEGGYTAAIIRKDHVMLEKNRQILKDRIAKELQAAKAEARNEHYKAALLQMKRWANLHEVIGIDTINDYVDHVVESLNQLPEQQLPTLAELEATPKEEKDTE